MCVTDTVKNKINTVFNYSIRRVETEFFDSVRCRTQCTHRMVFVRGYCSFISFRTMMDDCVYYFSIHFLSRNVLRSIRVHSRHVDRVAKPTAVRQFLSLISFFFCLARILRAHTHKHSRFVPLSLYIFITSLNVMDGFVYRTMIKWNIFFSSSVRFSRNVRTNAE